MMGPIYKLGAPSFSSTTMTNHEASHLNNDIDFSGDSLNICMVELSFSTIGHDHPLQHGAHEIKCFVSLLFALWRIVDPYFSQLIHDFAIMLATELSTTCLANHKTTHTWLTSITETSSKWRRTSNSKYVSPASVHWIFYFYFYLFIYLFSFLIN